MDNEKLIASLAQFGKENNINKPTLMNMLKEVFQTLVIQDFGSDENFDVVINPEKGDLEIWHFREVVANDQEGYDSIRMIKLDDAQKIASDFKEGEEVDQKIPLNYFSRRSIARGLKVLIQKRYFLEEKQRFEQYQRMKGEMVYAEIHYIKPQEAILYDDERTELTLPKSQQIRREFLQRGTRIHAIIHDVQLVNNKLKVILSRTSELFLRKLLEREVPELESEIIEIKKIARIPGVRAKVAVMSHDDRVDPVGACVGPRGSRIRTIVRELANEQIDIIQHVDNEYNYLQRLLNPANLTTIKEEEGRIHVYLKPDQVALAIGANGQNIELASKMMGKPIDIYKEVDEEEGGTDTE